MRRTMRRRKSRTFGTVQHAQSPGNALEKARTPILVQCADDDCNSPSRNRELLIKNPLTKSGRGQTRTQRAPDAQSIGHMYQTPRANPPLRSTATTRQDRQHHDRGTATRR